MIVSLGKHSHGDDLRRQSKDGLLERPSAKVEGRRER